MDRAFSPEFPREPLSRVDFSLRLYRLFCTQSRKEITECQSVEDLKEKHLLLNWWWVIWNTFMVMVFGSTQKSILKVLEREHELYKSFNEVYSQRKKIASWVMVIRKVQNCGSSALFFFFTEKGEIHNHFNCDASHFPYTLANKESFHQTDLKCNATDNCLCFPLARRHLKSL